MIDFENLDLESIDYIDGPKITNEELALIALALLKTVSLEKTEQLNLWQSNSISESHLGIQLKVNHYE